MTIAVGVSMKTLDPRCDKEIVTLAWNGASTAVAELDDISTHNAMTPSLLQNLTA